MRNLLNRFKLYAALGLVIFVSLGLLVYFFSHKTAPAKSEKITDVSLPTIYNGELILPKVSGALDNNVSRAAFAGKLSVISANLAAIFENNQLTGIRIVGETGNVGDKDVTGVSPLVRFYDKDGKLAGQKVARPSKDFDFKTISARDKALYDVTVDSPSASDRVEIVFNVTASTDSAGYKPLLISNRKIETRTADVNADAPAGTESARTAPSQKVEYYVVSGQVNNPLENPVTDITIYAWSKDEANRVFALGRQDFKNDLINPGEKIEFKVMLLPIRSDQTYSTYEISAWGREYKILP